MVGCTDISQECPSVQDLEGEFEVDEVSDSALLDAEVAVEGDLVTVTYGTENGRRYRATCEIEPPGE